MDAGCRRSAPPAGRDAEACGGGEVVAQHQRRNATHAPSRLQGWPDGVAREDAEPLDGALRVAVTSRSPSSSMATVVASSGGTGPRSRRHHVADPAAEQDAQEFRLAATK